MANKKNNTEAEIEEKVAKVESLVVTELGIPYEFCGFVEKWYDQHVGCGRKS